MITIRRVVQNKKGKIEIEIPKEITSQEVEVMISPIGPNPDSSRGERLKALYGKLNLNMTIDEIDESLRKLRSEWDRDIY